MTITVAANGASTPPRFEITVATPDGSNLTAITLWRRVGGVNALTRVQPSTGLPTRYVEDYEAPWDTPVSYVATYSYAGGSTTETSAAASLTPDTPALWAIHPTVPSLSLPLDTQDFGVMGLASAGDVTRKAQASLHDIVGSSLPLLTKTGNRKAAASQLELTTVTEYEKLRVLAITNDETPLLLRAPGSWHWGIEEGYYAVSDTGEARRLQFGPDQSRTIRLPIQRVQPPAGAQQSSWSWGGLMSGYADWGSVQGAYGDWNAVTGNSPA